MTSERTKGLLIGAAGGALIATFLENVQKARAAGAPEGMDPQVWEMYIQTIEATAVQAQQVNDLVLSLNQLTLSMGGVPAGGEDPFSNFGKGITGQVICSTANLGFQLPPIVVPKNRQLVVKALPGNVGWVYLAFQQSDSQNMLVAYPMVIQEAVGLFVTSADLVWVMAPTVNDGVAYIVEQG